MRKQCDQLRMCNSLQNKCCLKVTTWKAKSRGGEKDYHGIKVTKERKKKKVTKETYIWIGSGY